MDGAAARGVSGGNSLRSWPRRARSNRWRGAGDLAAEALAVAATHGPLPPRMIALETLREDGAILDPPSAP